jgi:hypothetical protein
MQSTVQKHENNIKNIYSESRVVEFDKQTLPTLQTKSQLNSIIVNKDGSPDHLAINIYLDTLCAWQVYGDILRTKKIKTSGIYCNAKQLAKPHGMSKETIRKKIVKLEKSELIQ